MFPRNARTSPSTSGATRYIPVKVPIFSISEAEYTLIDMKFTSKSGTESFDELIARVYSAILVSDEKKQLGATLRNPANRKIPAVCAMPEVNVECISFIEYLRASRTIFH
jgi:hypothetical protein